MHTVRTKLCSTVVLFGLLTLVLLAGCGSGDMSLLGAGRAVGVGDLLMDDVRSSAKPKPLPKLDLSGADERLEVELNAVEASRNNITAGPSATQRQLTVRFMGRCADDGGLWVYGRGFAPGGEFLIGANYPADSSLDGGSYSRLPRGGWAGKDGSVAAVRLECVDPQTKLRDPSGIYTAVFNDLTTGERVRATFVMR